MSHLSDNEHEPAYRAACPADLLPRRSPRAWRTILWTPLEALMVSTSACIGLAGLASRSRFYLPVPGVIAGVVQGLVVLLHGLCEGPRLQLLPIYLSVPLLAVNAGGGLGDSTVTMVAVGAMALLLGSCSLLLCYLMPCLFPIDARGPCAVAIATEHIRTTVDNPGTKMAAGQEELRPLELMAQVFYPVDKFCVADLPWFPSSIAKFRRSLVPAWGGARRVPFGLTQAGILGASIILGTARSRCTADFSTHEGFPSFSSVMTHSCTWAGLAAVVMCLTCFVSDLMVGTSRAAYQARYLGREQAKHIAIFLGMPGWVTEHVCGFHGKGFEAGHFRGPDIPCFPVAPIKPGDNKRPVVLFSHGVGGNRALYAELAGEIASHGFVVVAMEHNDGSGSSCMFPDGRLTPCIPGPNVAQIAAQENQAYQLAQLRRRGREVQLVRTHLKKLELGVDSDFEACRRVGLGSVIDTKRPAYLGHSFGGASVLQGLSDEHSEKRRESNDEKGFSMAFLMDPWTFPLSQEACDHRIDIPVMIMTTDTFLAEEATAKEDRIIHHAVSTVKDDANDLAMQLRVKDVEHNNFSDIALFAPGVLRKLGGAGKMDGVTFLDQLSRLIICALELFLRRRTDSGDAERTPTPTKLSSVLLGSDLSAVFPEARVRRGCAAGVLPSMEKHNG